MFQVYSHQKVIQILFCRFDSPTKTKKMTDRKAVIKNADMSEDMQQDAVDCATQAIEKYNIEKVRSDYSYSIDWSQSVIAS